MSLTCGMMRSSLMYMRLSTPVALQYRSQCCFSMVIRVLVSILNGTAMVI